jgi:hypothetical protein
MDKASLRRREHDAIRVVVRKQQWRNTYIHTYIIKFEGPGFFPFAFRLRAQNTATRESEKRKKNQNLFSHYDKKIHATRWEGPVVGSTVWWIPSLIKEPQNARPLKVTWHQRRKRISESSLDWDLNIKQRLPSLTSIHAKLHIIATSIVQNDRLQTSCQ